MKPLIGAVNPCYSMWTRPRETVLFAIVPLLLAAATPLWGQEEEKPGSRPDCQPPDAVACWRQDEQAFIEQWPEIATRNGDTLTIHLDSWGVLQLIDFPAIGDQKRMWAFRGVANRGDGILIDELRYHGRELWMIDRIVGDVVKFPCGILPSPSESWLFCAWSEFDEMAMAYRGTVRIYAMNSRDAPVLEVEHNLGPFRAVRPQWVEYGRVEFGVEHLTGEKAGEETGCTFTLDHREEWRFSDCVE